MCAAGQIQGNNRSATLPAHSGNVDFNLSCGTTPIDENIDDKKILETEVGGLPE